MRLLACSRPQTPVMLLATSRLWLRPWPVTPAPAGRPQTSRLASASPGRVVRQTLSGISPAVYGWPRGSVLPRSPPGGRLTAIATGSATASAATSYGHPEPAPRDQGAAYDVRTRRRSLRPHAVQPLRAQRAAAAGDLARPVAELRRRPPARDEPRDRAPRVRPRHHPLRPGEQLRPAVRLGGGDVRRASCSRISRLPRRARDLHEGRLRHVARALRRLRVAQVPAREPRPEPAAHGPRLRRHLLLAPARPGHADGGDAGRARHRRARRARRSTRASRRTRPSAPREAAADPARAGDAAAHPPAVVLACSTAGSSRDCWTCSADAGRRLHRLLAARPGHAHRPLPATGSRRTRARAARARSRAIC